MEEAQSCGGDCRWAMAAMRRRRRTGLVWCLPVPGLSENWNDLSDSRQKWGSVVWTHT